MSVNNLLFPSQKVSESKKTDAWHEQCCESALATEYFSNSKIRNSRSSKIANYQLYDGQLIDEDIEKVFNSMGLTDAVIPAKMQNYPIELPKFERLIGEESKRKFNWRLRAINDDVVAEIGTLKKEAFMSIVAEEIQNAKYDQKKAEEKFRKIEEYYNYEYQDIREKWGNASLKYIYNEQILSEKFNRGFKDVLISSEEIYAVDIVNGEPRCRKCNPISIYTLRMGESHKIEDSDIIIEDSYRSIGAVVDDYHDELTPDQIDTLYSQRSSISPVMIGSSGIVNYSANTDIPNIGMVNDNGTITLNTTSSNYYGTNYDTEGNVRVIRVCWKSQRKVGDLKFYDEEGNEQHDYVDEYYKPDKTKGEEVKWTWINEWRETTKVADFYLKRQRYPVCVYDMDTLELKTHPYVGTVYNTNIGKGISLMDRLKPYKYQYNIYSRRLELAFAKWKGPLMEMDLAKKPEHWEVEKWLSYAEIHGYLIVDSFAEGQKGLATGKLAGNFNTTGKVLNPDIGNYIQHMINTLEMIKRNISEISGVTPEREGQSVPSQTLGSIDNSVTQSAYITEEWFMLHDNTKLRVMQQLLEVAKVAWRGRQKKISYIMGDLQRVFMTIDGDVFYETNYGLMVNNSADDAALMAILRQLAQAAWQNDKMSMSRYMSILMADNSIASVRRQIEAEERATMEREQTNLEAERELKMQLIQEQAKERMLDRMLEQYKTDQNNITKINVAEIQAYMRQQELDLDNDGIPDPIEIGKNAIAEYAVMSKEQLEREKIATQEKIARLKADVDKYKADRDLEREKIKARTARVNKVVGEK